MGGIDDRNVHSVEIVAGVQWHPEFRQRTDPRLFDDNPILFDFLQYARGLKLKSEKTIGYE